MTTELEGVVDSGAGLIEAVDHLARRHSRHALTEGLDIVDGKVRDWRYAIEDESGPARSRGDWTFTDAESFLAYLARYADPASAGVYFTPNPAPSGSMPVAVAVLDDGYPGNEQPVGMGEWTARLRLDLAPEWQAWARRDGDLMSQVDFAEHIEANLVDIVSPDGADLLEIVTTIQGHRNAEFVNSTRLADGTRGFGWREETTASAGASGQLAIPEQFQLYLPMFAGGDNVALTARLRWRLNNGDLRIGFKLDRPERAIAEAIGQVRDEVRVGLAAGFGVFVGVPAAHRRTFTPPAAM